jgi:hypothetical protein
MMITEPAAQQKPPMVRRKRN